MMKEHQYVNLLEKRLVQLVTYQDKIAPIFTDLRKFQDYPDIVQEVLYQEARSISRHIEKVENKIMEYYNASQKEQIELNMTAWFVEEKEKRASNR
jgi:predicted translin family RNA/ssDNA-binding protein